MHTKLTLMEERIRHLEAQLEETNAERIKYKKLFDVSGDALSIIDLSTGRFIECNQAAVVLHGVASKDNFLNLRPADLSPELQPCGRRSDKMASEYIAKTFTDGPQLFQWIHARSDGSTFPCLVSLTALPLGDKNLVLAIGRDITELSETQTQLENAVSDIERFQSAYLEEKEKFEQFVNLAPVGIVINRLSDGQFEYVNNEFSRFTGYGVDELNDMDYWQLTPKSYEDQEQHMLTLLAEEGRYGPYKKEYIHKLGHTYPVQLSGVKIAKSDGTEYIWSVVQDISAQQRIEKQLQATKDEAELSAFRMKLANDSAGIGVWEWDVVTNELIWDDWMYALYGIKEADFSGAYEAWESSVHPDDIEATKTLLFDAVAGKGTYDPEFRVVHPNGQIRTMKASAEVIRDANGQALKVVGVNYDITDKVNSISELQKAKLAADQANRAKSEFLANMSHEIRTPMNAILGGLQLLQNTQLSDDLKTILINASSSAKSLLTLINDILDYSKIENNKLELEQQPFLFSEVVKSVQFDVDTLVSNKGIDLVHVVDKSFTNGWLGDIVRVKQILLNLVSNAVKFTEKGRVTIELSCKEYQGKKAVCICVADSGIGMSGAAQARIFERFEQADSSTTRKFGGTGLGMSITINLVKLMGGTVNLSSQIGRGTTVDVILPLEKSDKNTTAQAHKAVVAPQLSGKKILIAEDNPINQVLIKSMLKDTNAELTLVANGKLAVEAAEQKDFDLILMDIQMPEMDGVEAQQQIHKINSDIRIIALTANVMLADVERYLQQGFTAHIGKPVDMNNLYGVLTRYLS
ncbi:PAS domain-containing hybrid sensor histidine kinase/response regulator [Pseudoalteromonas sp. S16_S37]|uniref:PAS domain-containing hybrid sensor histidine kinase/response regulator n=1 Tax=Pseudoalteromonas sp. S16_S37 TaxID=2720228 RepID=UPI00168142B8|nr:PAS domain S-box protein [Pseudoalteromonas sp. S16_S37]MBD1584709.1 PAS domain S-box protein [Pseudoalteromonas sp. S16_S37]